MLEKQSFCCGDDFLIKSLSADVTTFEVSLFSLDLMNTGRISISSVSGDDEFDVELVSVVMVDDDSSDDSISLILSRAAETGDSLSQS